MPIWLQSLYPTVFKRHRIPFLSLIQEIFVITVLDLYKETQGELKPAKSKLPYGFTILGKIQLSISFLPEAD